MNPHCRIGKIRHKAAPHLIEIVPQVRGADFPATLKNHAEYIGQHLLSDGGMAGFVVVAWGFDGQFMRGTRFHRDSFVGKTFAPAFVAEVLRRDTAADVANEVMRGEW
jgi:hypothetical protein